MCADRHKILVEEIGFINIYPVPYGTEYPTSSLYSTHIQSLSGFILKLKANTKKFPFSFSYAERNSGNKFANLFRLVI